MEKVDLNRVFMTLTPERRTEVVAKVNGDRLRLVRLSGPGTLDTHQHDEFALVLNGELTVEFGERKVVLGPSQGVLIPRGTQHTATGRDAQFVLFEPNPDAR
jgi:mannose-6-phosphate isomerase-like protein (cupin superfamily)